MSLVPPEPASGTTESVQRIPDAAPAVGVLTILPLALLAVFAALSEVRRGGDDSTASSAPTAEFGEAFEPAGRVSLEEPGSTVVSVIRRIAVRDDGVLAVPDPRQDHVRFYGPDGALLADAGGSGSGPGELDFPSDVAFDAEGRLYVAEGGHPRVSRYGRDFAFDTVFRVDSAYRASEVAAVGEKWIIYANRPGAGTPSLRTYAPDGELETEFHPRREEYQTVPYWSAAADRLVAASESHVVAGGNLLYPFVRYTPSGTLRDSIGTPPPTWEQAPRPEPGRFVGGDQRKQFEKWRRTFTTVDNVAIYRDSLLVVSHRELDPEVLAYEDAAYRADVYRIASGRKILEDVPLPGRLLEGGRHVHLLLSTPPDPWTVGRFRVSGGGFAP